MELARRVIYQTKMEGFGIRPLSLMRAFRVIGRRGSNPENAVAEIEKRIPNAHARNLYFGPKRSHLRKIARILNIASIGIHHRANRAHRALEGAQVRPLSRKEKSRKADRKYRAN